MLIRRTIRLTMPLQGTKPARSTGTSSGGSERPASAAPAVSPAVDMHHYVIMVNLLNKLTADIATAINNPTNACIEPILRDVRKLHDILVNLSDKEIKLGATGANAPSAAQALVLFRLLKDIAAQADTGATPWAPNEQLAFISEAIAKLMPDADVNKESHNRIKEFVQAMRKEAKLKLGAGTTTTPADDVYCNRCHNTNVAAQGSHDTLACRAKNGCFKNGNLRTDWVQGEPRPRDHRPRYDNTRGFDRHPPRQDYRRPARYDERQARPPPRDDRDQDRRPPHQRADPRDHRDRDRDEHYRAAGRGRGGKRY
jgi:hypothetical protein